MTMNLKGRPPSDVGNDADDAYKLDRDSRWALIAIRIYGIVSVKSIGTVAINDMSNARGGTMQRIREHALMKVVRRIVEANLHALRVYVLWAFRWLCSCVCVTIELRESSEAD